jgi:hypothetical protein
MEACGPREWEVPSTNGMLALSVPVGQDRTSIDLGLGKLENGVLLDPGSGPALGVGLPCLFFRGTVTETEH